MSKLQKPLSLFYIRCLATFVIWIICAFTSYARNGDRTRCTDGWRTQPKQSLQIYSLLCSTLSLRTHALWNVETNQWSIYTRKLNKWAHRVWCFNSSNVCVRVVRLLFYSVLLCVHWPMSECYSHLTMRYTRAYVSGGDNHWCLERIFRSIFSIGMRMLYNTASNSFQFFIWIRRLVINEIIDLVKYSYGK